MGGDEEERSCVTKHNMFDFLENKRAMGRLDLKPCSIPLMASSYYDIQ